MTTKLNDILEGMAYGELMIIDGFDEAVLGVGSRVGMDVLVYDRKIMVDILTERDGMTELEAQEYIDYNITGAWMGDLTPIVLDRFDNE